MCVTAWLLFSFSAINSTSEGHICSQFCLVLLCGAFRLSSERSDKQGSSATALDNEQQRLKLPICGSMGPSPNLPFPSTLSLPRPPVKRQHSTLSEGWTGKAAEKRNILCFFVSLHCVTICNRQQEARSICTLVNNNGSAQRVHGSALRRTINRLSGPDVIICTYWRQKEPLMGTDEHVSWGGGSYIWVIYIYVYHNAAAHGNAP